MIDINDKIHIRWHTNNINDKEFMFKKSYHHNNFQLGTWKKVEFLKSLHVGR